jgi:two-component system sensor histidine kinase KdpD
MAIIEMLRSLPGGGAMATGRHSETPERVVVALTGGPEGETLIRRDRSWRSRRSGLSLGRRTGGFILTIAALPLLTWLLLAVDANVSLSTDILVFLLLVVAVSLVGGLFPAVLAAVGGFLVLNYFFTPPVRMFTVAERGEPACLVGVSGCRGIDQHSRRPRGPPNSGSIPG